MAKQLMFLNEAGLRLRVHNQHAEVYFRSNSSVSMGSQFLGCIADTNDHDRAWEMIDRYLGHLMPADLVDDEIVDQFEGIAYIGGGFSTITCPNCQKPLQGQELDIDPNMNSQKSKCPHCGGWFTIIMSEALME